MKRFAGQTVIDVAMKCVEAIAKGKITKQETRKNITYENILVNLVPDSKWCESKALRENGKKKEEFWVLTGFEVVENDKEYGIFESVDVTGGGNLPTCPTHTMPLVPRHGMGATNSNKILLGKSFPEVNPAWLWDL